MERRRFNMSSMSPMADSTRIDASLISNRPAATFLRGLSPKSNTSLNGTRTPERALMNRSVSSSSSMSRQKLNRSQVDPRTFADVHSSGLTSRIVALSERSGLQRSMSASNLYNPMTQPRRAPGSPLPYKSRAPTLSITQIAPPERSFYSGNTLSSLLRSNSLVGLVQKTSEQEQLSRENRPILHPPHPQHESEPTRSVLEELKEISRKRINTGDTQHAQDNTKRSCQRSFDFVDHHRHQQQIHHLQQQQNQSFKRQRELTVSVPLRHHSTSLSAAPPALQHMHSNGNISPTQSPEQVAKRRNCSYSNDIASSLSSSFRHSNKRKLLDMRERFQHSKNDTLASGGSSPENSPENVAKIQRKVDAEAVSKSVSMPVVAVSAVPPSRAISAPAIQKVVPLVTEKPKLTLFNARQSETQVEQPRHDLSSPEVDAGEYAGIQFVKPKQQNSMLAAKNPSLERTHKTKLAIMLSGLKGELYQGEPDELDAPAPKSAASPATLPTPIKPIIIAPVTTSTTAVISTATISTAPSKPVILSNQVIKPADVPKTISTGSVPKLVLGKPAPPAKTEQTPPKPIDKVPAGQADIPAKFELSTKPVTPATSAQPLISFGTPKSTAAPSFSFGTATNTSSSTTTNTTNTTTSKPIFSFGQTPANGPTVGGLSVFKTDTPATTSVSTTNPGTPVTSTITFGVTPPKTTTTVAPTTTVSLSFGQPNSATLVATSKSTTTATMPSFEAANTAVKPMFSFGKSNNLSSGTPTNKGSDAAAAKPALFSFGGTTTQPAAAAAAPTPVFGSLSKPLAGGFASPGANKSETTKPGIFGNLDNGLGNVMKPPANVAATTAAELPKPFGFAATTTAAGGGSTATNLFAFGGTATSKAAEPAPASQKNLFGQNATTTTPFAFGGAAAAIAGKSENKDNKPFAFGGGDNNAVAKPSGVFSFGGTDKSAPPAFGSGTTSVTSATATPTNNTFGFGTAQKPATPMFGSGSTQQSSTPAVAATKPFTFGGRAPQAPTTPSASPASGGFSFSAVAAKNTTAPTAETNMFGSPASASKSSFNFGGNTATQAPAAGSPAGGFSFAAAIKKEDPASTNMFGSPNTGVVKPNFGFSSTNPTPAPTFGGFGAPAAAAPTATSTNQSKPFAFGASTPAAAPSAAPLGGNLFANAVSSTQNQTKPPGVFSFGTAKSTAGTTAGNAPFSFGGASAGGIASPPSNQGLNTAKPFSFGGAGGTPAPNVFGSPAPAPPVSNPAGGFNFGGASPAQQANAGNMFAPPTPEGRPIRKATRRLQK
ncbi:mucin-5AC isoform X1 [Drosophila sechellia]|uniref:mucin-5AC isoform X1 n=1 Tax=Drosophila sechellia TaxID=7238 RepID=UPI0013DE1B2C|nr:mucin-5AC isoform X1 [Drosophila sechellia]